MVRRKIFIQVVLACMLCCLGLTTEAAPAVKTKSSGIDFLFVITLKKAFFKQVSGREYLLTVPLGKVGSVLAFSNRPVRTAFSINPKKFSKLIHIGKAVYANDPPNISLVFDKNAVSNVAFQVESYNLTKTAVKYTLKKLGKTKVPSYYQGNMVVFVDSSFSSAGQWAQGLVNKFWGDSVVGDIDDDSFDDF